MGMKTLLIIPAYNEQENIGNTLDELAGYSGFDIVVIDDGSTDNTAEICRQRKAKCISLPFNMGLPDAFKTGMLYAYSNNYDAAMQFDADGQHKPEYIRPILEQLNSGADIVIGSRFKTVRHDRSMRQFGASFIRASIRLMTGQTITDPTSGMRAYDKRMIALFATGHDLTPEPDTLAFLMRQGIRVSEAQVEMRERQFGKSYLTAFNSIKYMIRMALSIFLIQFVRPEIKAKEGTQL